jgi:xylulokinase
MGHPIELLAGHPGSCLGAAYAAGVAVGAFAGWDDIARYVRLAGVVAPNPANAGRYARQYEIYRELYDRLQPLYPRLAVT